MKVVDGLAWNSKFQIASTSRSESLVVAKQRLNLEIMAGILLGNGGCRFFSGVLMVFGSGTYRRERIGREDAVKDVNCPGGTTLFATVLESAFRKNDLYRRVLTENAIFLYGFVYLQEALVVCLFRKFVTFFNGQAGLKNVESPTNQEEETKRTVELNFAYRVTVCFIE